MATGVGLLVPEFYRDTEILFPQLYGQDLLTLVVAVPALAGVLYYAYRGSLRSYVVWFGVTGYLLYTYASYAFLTTFNESILSTLRFSHWRCSRSSAALLASTQQT